MLTVYSKLKLILFFTAIKGELVQSNYCCPKKIVNGITYILTNKPGLYPDPQCLNDCIYEVAYNPGSYVCFKSGPYPPKCVGGGQAIFIAGGITDQSYRTESYYDPFSNTFCDITPSNYQRYSSTTTGFKICGGTDLNTGEALLNCETFDPSAPYPGQWSVTNTWDGPPRVNHVAWKTYSGLYLIGGYEAPCSTTLLLPDGSSADGFLLDYSSAFSCAVPDKKTDTVIIIGGYQGDCDGYGSGYGNETTESPDDGYGYGVGYGGSTYYPSDKVTVYNQYGYVGSLPNLNFGRIYAGCSGYYDYDDNLVLIVTGGTAGYTEKLVVGVDDAWMPVYGYGDDNPMDISCATANNDPFCLQGFYGYDVKKWNKGEDTFETVLETPYWRGYYGNFASAVPADAGALYQCLPSYGYGYGTGGRKQESNSDDFIIPVRPDVPKLANTTTPETKPAK